MVNLGEMPRARKQGGRASQAGLHHRLVRRPGHQAIVRKVLDQDAVATTGDLARQIDALGRMDMIIHNAGVRSAPQVLVVNTVAVHAPRPRRSRTGGRTSTATL